MMLSSESQSSWEKEAGLSAFLTGEASAEAALTVKGHKSQGYCECDVVVV